MINFCIFDTNLASVVATSSDERRQQQEGRVPRRHRHSDEAADALAGRRAPPHISHSDLSRARRQLQPDLRDRDLNVGVLVGRVVVEQEDGHGAPRLRLGPQQERSLGAGVKVILMPPCILCIENH